MTVTDAIQDAIKSHVQHCGEYPLAIIVGKTVHKELVKAARKQANGHVPAGQIKRITKFMGIDVERQKIEGWQLRLGPAEKKRHIEQRTFRFGGKE